MRADEQAPAVSRWYEVASLPGMFWLAIVLGTVARVAVATFGHNFDIESYRIVADIVAAGDNVYAGTPRYNYGPIWFHVLGALDAMPSAGAVPLIALRWKVTVFLTLVDVGIAWVLGSRFGAPTAILFFLNPVSVLITGYHGQFDNLAILVGLLGVLAMERRSRGPRWMWLGLAMIGASLATKHLLFAFPVWLAVRERSWRAKLKVMMVPYGLFALGFVPYLRDGWPGIVDHVVLYRSFENAPFWLGLMPAALVGIYHPMALFFGTLLLLGLVWRRTGVLESFLLYLVAVVVFSSAITNQYLAIPMTTIAVWPSWPYAAYTLATTAYLSASPQGLHLVASQPWLQSRGVHGPIGYKPLIVLLALGLCWQRLDPGRRRRVIESIKAGVVWCLRELDGQLKAPW
jgi:hypothetical protein